MMKDHGLDGAPTMAVQGSCRVSGDLAQSPTDDRILQAVDELVGRVHARQAAGQREVSAAVGRPVTPRGHRAVATPLPRAQ